MFLFFAVIFTIYEIITNAAKEDLQSMHEQRGHQTVKFYSNNCLEKSVIVFKLLSECTDLIP